jgi:hypothetical protein
MHTVRSKAERGVTNAWGLQPRSANAQRLPVAAVVGVTILDQSCWTQERPLTPFVAEPSHQRAGR